MAELPGSFGKYFLCDKIAAGGMAEIYLAKLIGPGGFEKQLVLKQISPELSKERQFVELFVAEAKTLVSLSHGNIVPVYELGVVDDTYFIAMEYVDGPTLGELMLALDARGERAEPTVAAHIAAELCKGLDYAHRKGEGVVHRDLSPRNVLLSRDGEVKLVDFGLALAGGRARRAHTGAGLPAGSFPYMSPEQVRREALDPRSDLFSLGVLLWEMLTGASLFARDDADETLAAVLSAPIAPPSTLQPGVPPELDRICQRALTRNRDERCQSAADLLAALTRFAYSVDPPVTQATLAALVARTCPPGGPRSHDDRSGDRSGDRSDDRSGERSRDPSQPRATSGDELQRTRPLGPRPARKHPATMRTFATSDEFDQVLANATPLLPFPALSEAAARRLDELAPRRAAPSPQAPARSPRRRSWRWPAAAGVAAVTIAALAMTRNQDQPETRSTETQPAAGGATRAMANAAVQTAAVRPIGASRDGARPAETGPADDPIGKAAPVAPSTAASPRTSPAIESSPDAGKPKRPRGQGTLQVGANPWADVYVDGALLGQAPGSWPVSVGPHAVELRHRERRRSFRISVEPGETEALGLIDFTAP